MSSLDRKELIAHISFWAAVICSILVGSFEASWARTVGVWIFIIMAIVQALILREIDSYRDEVEEQENEHLPH